MELLFGYYKLTYERFKLRRLMITSGNCTHCGSLWPSTPVSGCRFYCNGHSTRVMFWIVSAMDRQTLSRAALLQRV